MRSNLYAVKMAGQYGYMDAKGRLRIEGRFLDACPFWRGMATIRTSDGWRYINRAGTGAV